MLHSLISIRRVLSTLALTLTVAINVAASARTFSPQDFGAVVDGNTLDTTALQKAIDAAHTAGGGIVRFTAGRYCTGTLELRSGVTLHLEAGAVLLGSPRLADYRRGYWPALIKARGQERIAITGEGIIDGQGKLVAADSVRLWESGDYLALYPDLKPGDKISAWTGDNFEVTVEPHAMEREALAKKTAPRSRKDMATWRVDEHVRPQLLEIWDCRDVRVQGVTLRHAANWVQTYRESSDIVISGIKVDSTTYWNNDGIDIVNCQQVRIEDCTVDSADDGICLKSEPSRTGRSCEDIVVARCRVRSSANAVKLGTASHTAFRRIRIEDIEVYDTFRSALAIESVDGAVIEDLSAARFRARKTGNAFFLCINTRGGKTPGRLHNVILEDFEVHVPAGKPDAGYPHEGPVRFISNVIPSSIVGLPERPVENVVLRNITIVYEGGGSRDRAEVPLAKLHQIPEKRGQYPEFSMFGELPAWGLFLRDARGVRFENVVLRLQNTDFRSAVVADRIHDIDLSGLQLSGPSGEPVLVLSGVTDEKLDGIRWPIETTEHVRRLPLPVK
jgi:hypothetical protein